MNRFIASTLLTGLLCACSVTTWAADPTPASPLPPAAASGFRPGPGQGRGAMGPRCFSMKQTLNLSDKQDARLRELRQAHFQQVGPLRQELFRLKGELADLSVSKKPDEKKVSEVAGLIGRQHEKLALLESRHLQELSTVLNRKQIDMLLKMKESRGFRRGGGWR